MFTPITIIDTIQDTKRALTNQFIKDSTLNKVANEYITAQTTFAKMLANNAIDLTKYSVECFSKQLFPRPVEVTKAARAKASKAESAAAQTTDTNTQGE